LENLPSYLVTNGFLADVEANRVNLAILRANANEKLAQTQGKLAQTQDKLAQTQDELAQTQDKLKERDADIQQLLSWLKNSETAFHALLNSNRWKLGNRIGELWLRLRGKPKEPLITDDLFDLFNHLHEWEQKGVPAIQKSARNFTHITAEIVICVHNALVDVKVCLDSIRNNTASRHRLTIVDDGSNDECRDYLSNYSSQHENVTLIRNESARGYTIAANQGLQKSRAEFVVLLNSDTILTPNWLENLLECAESSQQIGIVGPLSNAASWQSVPELFDLAKDWSINPLPPGWNPNQMAELVTSYSHKEFPRVPLLNGFCLAMKRSVIEKIGYLDEQSFPEGYGEENDYCIRAVDAGFELAVADHVYIYHSKSKSYTHDRRLALSKRSQSALTSKHSSERIDRDVTVLRQQPVLQKMRNRVNQAIKNQKSQRSNLVVANQETKPFSVMFLVLLQKVRNRVNQAIKNRRSQNSNSLLSNQETKPFSVMFVLPVSGWGGGIHSIFQETAAMRIMGANATIAVPRSK